MSTTRAVRTRQDALRQRHGPGATSRTSPGSGRAVDRRSSLAPDRPLSVLVPLDGSELAEEALQAADLLAGSSNAHLTLLRVVEPPTYPIYGDGYAYIPFDEDTEIRVCQAVPSGTDDYAARARADRQGGSPPLASRRAPSPRLPREQTGGSDRDGDARARRHLRGYYWAALPRARYARRRCRSY